MATLLKTWKTYYFRSGDGYPSLSYDACGFVKVYLDSQSIANNTSTIKIYHYIGTYGGNVYSASLGETTSSYRANNGSFGGTYQSFTASAFTIMGGTGFGEIYIGVKTHTITHNTDGTAQLYVNGSWNSKTLSFNMALPTIPRATTINSFTWAKSSGGAGLSRLSCNWATAHSIDRIQYSFNGGAYTTVTGSGTSGNFSISSLTPNTPYSMKIKVRRADSQVETESGTLNATTYDIAKITVAPNNNVNMDNTQAITYTNPSGASLETSVYRANGTVIAAYRGCSGTSYTFNFTSGEKTLFYNQIPTTKTLPLRFYLRTSDGLGNTYLHYVERTFEVFNANPTFTTWTYADTNATTVALTGSNQKIIKGYSNVKATITSANKMVANKGATATSYQLTIGTKPSATVAYSPSATVEMTVNAVDNNVFKCYAIDSRGNSTNVTKTITTDYINYTPISITSATATRTDNIGTETTLAFSGKIFDGSFGSVSNSVKTATYKFKKTTDSSYTNGTSVITPTKTGGTFSFSGTIKGDKGSGGVDGFDATYSYNIQVIVTDELSTKTFTFLLGSGTPNIAISQNGVAINQAYDETLGGALQVNGPVVSIGPNYLYTFKGTLPSGDGTRDYWQSIPAGIYWVTSAVTISGGSLKPSAYAFVQIIKYGATETCVYWQTQSITGGHLYKMGMNASSTLAYSSWTRLLTDADNTDSGWLSLNDQVKYRKVNNVVTVIGYSSNAVSVGNGSYTNVGTLPEGYRPAYLSYFEWSTLGGNYPIRGGSITTAGVIGLYLPSGSTTKYWGFTITYLV